MNYTHFGVKLPKTNINIFRDDDVRMEKTIAQPLMSLGYNYQLHLVKNELGVSDHISTLNQYPKIKRVNNPFEIKIYDSKDISSMSKEYFNIKVESRAFYKLWELSITFKNLISLKTNFKSLHLAEGPGGFIQATAEYRKKYGNDIKNDEYHAITIKDVNGGADLSDYSTLYGSKYRPFPIFLKKDSDKSTHKTNGDLTKWKTLYLLRKAYYRSENIIKSLESFDNKMPEINKNQVRFDLITADGGFNWLDENNQEQEAFVLILGEICHALSFQKEGGNFVLKVFDLFTNVSLKFILILQLFYQDIYITKPLTSRFTNAEKYIVCMNFKFKPDNKDYWTKLIKISSLFKKIIYQTQQSFYLNDFSRHILIPKKITNIVNLVNVTLVSQQIMEIQKFIQFIKSKNYYGQQYQVYINKQKRANQYWVNIFLQKEPKYLDKQIEEFTDGINKVIEKRYI